MIKSINVHTLAGKFKHFAGGSMEFNLTKRERKALRAASRRKFPDFSCVYILADKGYLSVQGPSDDVEILITDKGHAALKELDNKKE